MCCSGSVLHYVDAGARSGLFSIRENMEIEKCCGCCALCQMASVENRINIALGGSDSYNERCCCLYCCFQCKVCQFRRAMKKLEQQQQFPLGRKGAPQEDTIVR